MQIAELVRYLNEKHGISLSADNGKLKTRSDSADLDPDAVARIREHRDALIEFLSSATGVTTAGTEVIPRRPHPSSPAPLSFSQQRLWFIDRFDGGAAYYMPMALLLNGALDRAALLSALDALVARHEILRSGFVAEDGVPMQILVKERKRFELACHDLTRLDAIEREAAVAAHALEETRSAFDLEQGSLIRGRLLLLARDQHVLLITLHHIVSDGWSHGIMFKEVCALYAAIVAGRPDPLPPLRLQYADYALWQRDRLTEPSFALHMGYWRQRLNGTPDLHNLPVDRLRPQQQCFEGALVERAFGADFLQRMNALAHHYDASLFILLYAAFSVLLSRWSGESDIVVGTPVAGRLHPDVEPLIGVFINMLALRAEILAEQSFEDVLRKARSEFLAAYEHQEVPFEMLVDVLQPARSTSHSPLFQVMFTMQSEEQSGTDIEGLGISRMASQQVQAKFDLTLSATESENGLSLGWIFATALFERSSVERIADGFMLLLQALIENPQRAVGNIPLMSDQARAQLLHDFNDTDTIRTPGQTLHGLFEAQATLTPEAVALAYDGQTMSYSQLNAHANRLAHVLIGLGVCPEDRVAICVERGFEMVVGLLGILKAGGAYVPLDPDNPAARLRSMLDDCAPVALLSHTSLRGCAPLSDLAVGDIPVVWLDEPVAESSSDNPCVEGHTAAHLAYVIYTSGSTGRPKGAMNEHAAVVNRLLWAQSQFRLQASDRVLQKTPFGFDVSVWEFFLPLSTSAALVLARPGGHRDPAYLIETIVNESISIAHFVPSMLQVFLEHPKAGQCTGLRDVLCSGEALGEPACNRFANVLPDVGLHNLYGPTEAAVDVTYWNCGERTHPGLVPIGRPIDNTRIYILDDQGAPVPLGVVGELFIGGVQVGRGYLNLPELTEERFLRDPFSAANGARMYKTGDLARWLEDGAIEYIGRSDFQIKIRGFRIELGEIETRLLEIEGVREAAADARVDRTGEKHIVGYVSTAAGVALDQTALRVALSKTLPDYMVPAAFVFLPTLPLSANGKLDRRALPEPGEPAAERERYSPPVTQTDHTLAAIWRELLQLERVGIDDHFFHLGGHSLLATRVVSRIAEQIGSDLPVRTLFQNPTIRQLAAHIATLSPSQYNPILPVQRDGHMPLSFAQQRLWLINRIDGAGRQYNISNALQLSGTLDRTALQQALDALLARHEVLRTRFLEVDGIAQAVISPPQPFPLACIDQSAVADDASDTHLQAAISAETGREFDLSADLMIRAALILLGGGQHVLALTVHHIASDGWSMGVLARELAALYEAFRQGKPDPLPPLSIQYADFADWQRRNMRGEALEKCLAYWRTQLAGIPSAHNFPLDNPRPAQQQFTAGWVSRELAGNRLANVRDMAQRGEASLFMVLNAAFALLIGRWSGDRDVVVGSPVTGRVRKDLEPLIGCFLENLVIRTDLTGDDGFLVLLDRAKRTILDAFAYQAVPFHMLVDEIKPERALNHPPVFQISFSYHNLEEVTLELADIGLRRIGGGSDIARYDIELHITERVDMLRVNWMYADSVLEQETIERLADSFDALLDAACAEPERPVWSLPMLPERDRDAFADWCSPRAFTPDLCAHMLFEAQARRRPDAIAVWCDGEAMMYAELDALSNRIARYLIGKGVRTNDIVGLCVERSVEMMAGVLGILKSGAAYLPIDSNSPEERIAGMLEDAGVEHVLTHASVIEAVPALGERSVLLLDAGMRNIMLADSADHALSVQDVHVGPDDAAYVIYTSGTTGQPKGVILEHRGMVNLALNQSRLYGVADDSRMLSFASLGFDGAVFEWLMALTQGASLHICSQDERSSATALSDLLVGQRITHAAVPPAMLGQIDPDRNYALQVLIVAGEACDERLAWRWAERCRVCNSYGPSEATVAATHADVSPGRPITLGAVLDNVEIHVLNEGLQLQPIGVSGELCIGGQGLGRGYLGRPTLTAERFIDHPWRSGEYLYRTGDLARWQPNAELQLLGRIDDQIKLRGFRVEPGEVEAKLRQHVDVRDCVVLVREDDPGDRRLVAYIICESSEALRNEVLLAKEWRAHLRKSLPDYMVPTAFTILQALPLTVNGKLDRHRLPKPDYSAQQTFFPPTNDIESALVQLWQQVLRVEQVGIHDNFFEMGGDSILAIQLVSRSNQAGIRISTKQLFEAQTVADLAAVAGLGAKILQPQDAVEGTMPLLPIQHFFLESDSVDREHYNMAVLLRVPSTFDAGALRAALQAIHDRHDALRLRFAELDGRWTATFASLDDATMESVCIVEPVPADAEDASAFVTARCGHWQTAFDLAEGPLMRAVLFSSEDQEQEARLLILVHHIVIDGVSWRILLSDLERAYAQYLNGEVVSLPAKTSSFKQWAEALVAHAQSPALLAEKSYWLEQSTSRAPRHPVDRVVSLPQIASSRTVQIVLEEGETALLLQHCNSAYRTHINDLLLAGVYLGMRAWTGEDTLRIRLDGHGREPLFEHLDIGETIGYFTSVYPMNLRCSGTDIGAVVKQIKEQNRAVPNNGIGYGVLRHLATDPDILAAVDADEHALLEFNYLGQFDQVLNTDTHLQAAAESPGVKVSPQRRRLRQLGLSGKVFEGRMAFSLDYSADQYNEATMHHVADAIRGGLRSVIAHCAQQGVTGFTPSDFPLARVDQTALDDWHDRYPTMRRLYPATPLQAGLLFESLVDASAYVVQTFPVLSGDLDVVAFRSAWERTLRRHEILRTAFVDNGGELHQLVCGQVQLPWHEEDWRGLPEAEQASRFESYRLQDKQAGFDFTRPPLMRIALFRLDDERYRLLWTNHHILADGWSSPLIYRDVVTLYEADAARIPLVMPDAPLYETYIAWLARQDRGTAIAYWQEAIGHIETPTLIATERNLRADEHGTREQRLQLDAEETRALQAVAQTLHVTVNTIVQWGWGYLLHCYSGDPDVVFGTTISGRPAEIAGIEDMVGLFINTIPIPIRYHDRVDLRDSLTAFNRKFQTFASYGFLSLVDMQRLTMIPAGAPMFDSLLVFENLPIDAKIDAGRRTRSIEIEQVGNRRDTHYPLTLIVNPGENLRVSFGYRAEHFSETSISSIARRFGEILRRIPGWAATGNGEHSLFGSEDRKLTACWNDTARGYPDNACIHHLFSAQAQLRPDATALVSNGQRMSYAALELRASKLACRLHAAGVRRGHAVGLCTDRSFDFVVGVLGILKSGAAYVPLDTSLPEARIRFMLADSAAQVTVASARHAVLVSGDGMRIVEIDSQEEISAQSGDCNVIDTADADDAAFVMYTSGSTGKPKGVRLPHRTMVNLMTDLTARHPQLAETAPTLQFAAVGFDMSLYEICSALFTASPLVLLDEDDRLDMARLTEIMRSESVARVYLPTAMLQMFAHATIAGGIDLPSLKLVQVAGEALTITPAVREWAKRTGCALLNLYGPTESHVVSDFMLDDAPEQWPAVPSIGGPIANVEFHILDRTLRPQPTGMPGELFIGGHGLAIGYMGRDDLTAERFIEIDPGDGRRRRLYRTGDLARWRPDGTLDYLRRVDAQIKLRGFRIEPGEIEAILAAQDGVADAAVVVMGESNDRHLVAYVVCDGGDALLESLRVTLEHVLPYYMVPSFIVPLPALPLNANGKLDRRALPQPERNMAPRALPQTETEIRLASIWMRLLKLDQVGIDERFFEIGGHSLLATQMVTAVLADFEFKLTIKDVFSHQTIREIAQLIDVLKAYSGSAEKREPESEGELLEETEW